MSSKEKLYNAFHKALNSNLPSGLPVIDSNGKVIGVTNFDGTISITDIDYINEVINKKTCALSVAFKEVEDEQGIGSVK